MPRPADLIFETLLETNSLTIPQLSRMLHLTRADIRHHLNELMNQGRVTKTLSTANQVGRPAHTYQAIRPLNRSWIQTLIQTQAQMLQSFGLSDVEVSMQISDAILADFAPVGHPTTKLNQAVAHLHTKGIEASWIAGPEGPIIRLAETDFLSQNLAIAIIERIQKEL